MTGDTRLPAKLILRLMIFLHDLVMVMAAWFGAYWLRFNLASPPPKFLLAAEEALPLILLAQALVFYFLGLYRGVWRFASLPDLIRIMKSALLGVLMIALVLALVTRLQGVPRSVLPLYALLLTVFLSGPRLLFRFWKDQGLVLKEGQRALVVGAGRGAELLIRDLSSVRDARFVAVAIVDDDPRKKGSEIRGVRVRGGCDQIPDLVVSLGIEVILIAMPSAKDQEMRRIVGICEKAGIPFLTLPSVQFMLSEKLPNELREVAIEDLLGRSQVRLNPRLLEDRMRGCRVLVTGGGGSIGAELCRQISRLEPEALTIFDQCEFNLYTIEQDLRRRFPALKVHAILGDVTDGDAVREALLWAKPSILFHAAAYKHVPLLQSQVRQAIRNNVIGTRVLAEAAMAAKVCDFVLISTDKAVRPTNVMGATKRAAEKLIQGLNGLQSTRFMTVRFGNVLDSAGSVVPLFREQIRAGGPVTVTHPDVTRYFMTIPEACQLILQAAAVGQGGEIFVLDMGEPISICYLAEQMIRLSGKRVGEDVAITFVGLRPGEKLTEELFLGEEEPIPTPHPKLLRARSIDHDLEAFQLALEALEVSLSGPEAILRQKLRELVPEFADEGAT